MSFQRLVSALKKAEKTVTVVEQCCGGLISSSILAQSGASSVYYGGSISYNTRKAKPLLLNDEDLHQRLLQPKAPLPGETEADVYRRSKVDWTAQTSVAFCKALETDFCISEGGAAGPNFRPKGLDKGFAVIAIAGRSESGEVKVLRQETIHSPTADREANMRLFAKKAADLATQAVFDNSSISFEAAEFVSPQIVPRLDRATHLRSDKDALQALKFNAKFVVLRDRQVMVSSSTELAFLNHQEVQNIDEPKQTTFLGLLHSDGTPLFAVDLLQDDEGNPEAIKEKAYFVDTRTSAPLFSHLHNEIALHATAFAQWQRRSSFCSLCGAPAVLLQGGTCRQCTSCQSTTWPRQDPSMICVVESRCGNKILLARSPRHPPKMHTVLAGFVEAGETFEAAVARETWEETGILLDVGSIRYEGSQPWPFPQSCMIGFSATADAEQPLAIDETELLNAAWFDREQVMAASEVKGATMQHKVAEEILQRDPNLSLLIPPKGVIARKLIDGWLAR